MNETPQNPLDVEPYISTGKDWLTKAVEWVNQEVLIENTLWQEGLFLVLMGIAHIITTWHGQRLFDSMKNSRLLAPFVLVFQNSKFSPRYVWAPYYCGAIW